MTELLNSQQVFDKVARHLFAQGVRATSPLLGGCAYRANDGGKILKCAVGCLIPDDRYHPSMEKFNSPGAFTSQYPGVLPIAEDVSTSLLENLMTVHDSSENWESPQKMRDNLRNLASRFNLNSVVIEDLSFDPVEPH